MELKKKKEAYNLECERIVIMNCVCPHVSTTERNTVYVHCQHTTTDRHWLSVLLSFSSSSPQSEWHSCCIYKGGWVVVQVSCILCRLYLDLWYGLWLRQGVWPMRLHPCSHRPVCTDWCIWVWRRSPPSQHQETLRSRSSSWRQDYVSKAWGLCTQKLPEQKLCLLWLVCIVCSCIR